MTTRTKGWFDLSCEALRSSIRQHRAAMRMYAMDFRETIAPDGTDFLSSHSERMELAALKLTTALFYRNLANRQLGALCKRLQQRSP